MRKDHLLKRNFSHPVWSVYEVAVPRTVPRTKATRAVRPDIARFSAICESKLQFACSDWYSHRVGRLVRALIQRHASGVGDKDRISSI